jgi:serine-type D-Ala-D-Ala carboxypeptidase (penicillin-binding protein 5/6)
MTHFRSRSDSSAGKFSLAHALAFLVFCFGLLCPSPAAASGASPVTSASDAIVVDGWTGAVLFAKNPDALHAPASTAKIMTALLVLEHKIPMDRPFFVTAYAASFRGSTAGLVAGERITVWNLLHGLLMPSGNDAAVALAEGVAGNAPRFIRMMNLEARRLHLWHTHYLTPNGLDAPGQVTSARDLAELARTAMQSPRFARVVRTRYWSAWSFDHRAFHHWTNLNKLLWSSPAVDGIKTGTTSGAGACLVSSARRGGKWVIGVNLGSTYTARFDDGAKLLNYGLAKSAAPPSTRES